MDDYTGRDYIEHVWQWMGEYWKLQQPKLIIAVSGGAKEFDLHSRLSNALKKGLVNSAAKTGIICTVEPLLSNLLGEVMIRPDNKKIR